MPTYTKGDEKKYFSIIVAALIVIAVAVSAFVYSFIQGTDEDLPKVKVENVDGNQVLNPGGGEVPDHAPQVLTPTTPQPIN